MTKANAKDKRSWWNPLRWLRFNLKTALFLMFVCALLAFAKRQYDWQQRAVMVREWLEPLVAEEQTPIYIDSIPMLNTTALPTCPFDMTEREQIDILVFAATSLPEEKERAAAVKLLYEMYVRSRNDLRGIARSRAAPEETRALCIHLIATLDDKGDVAMLSDLMHDRSAVVRAATADAIGLRISDYYVPSWTPFTSGRTIQTDTLPRIQQELVAKVGSPSRRGLIRELTNDPILHDEVFARLENQMVRGRTSIEREAAARVFVASPPEDLQLRIAEWGVWTSHEDELVLPRAVQEEVPQFVHRTGNESGEFADRFSIIPMVVRKPVVHITVNRPAAIDFESHILFGRPWFAYPRPDDFALMPGSVYESPYRQQSNEGDFLRLHDNNDIAVLEGLREGYPFLLPRHRMHVTGGALRSTPNRIVGLGLRWQSVIATPNKLDWMQPPAVDDDPQHAWWKRLRDVDCSWVSNRGEADRFLYYDGPTFARSPIRAAIDNSTLKVTRLPIVPDPDEYGPLGIRSGQLTDDSFQRPSIVPRGLLIRVGKDSMTGLSVRTDDEVNTFDVSEELPLSDGDVKAALLESLQALRLTESEARGLVDCWRPQFFETPGTRYLGMFHRELYDVLCPARVHPEPDDFVRVGIVLIELD